jgi:hypothetical protein
VASRPPPRDLRASDADRERVVAVLTEAAADGRLTLGEHAERAERAYSARTLGDLTVLTADLAVPSAQPIRVDARRSVAGIFARERRSGRWVVPESLAVTAVFGEVILDLREALLQSRHVTIYATVIGGHVELIVPDGIAVVMTETAVFGRRHAGDGPPPRPGTPVIEIRSLALGGRVRVRVVTPRRGSWFAGLRRGGKGR